MKHDDFIDDEDQHNEILFDLGLLTYLDDHDLFIKYVEMMNEFDRVEDKDYEMYLELIKLKRKHRVEN